MIWAPGFAGAPFMLSLREPVFEALRLRLGLQTLAGSLPFPPPHSVRAGAKSNSTSQLKLLFVMHRCGKSTVFRFNTIFQNKRKISPSCHHPQNLIPSSVKF